MQYVAMLPIFLPQIVIKISFYWCAWVAQSVERPTSAQVMILRFVSSGPALGSVLTAQSLGPASDSVSPSLFRSLPHLCSLSLSEVHKHLKKFKKRKQYTNLVTKYVK